MSSQWPFPPQHCLLLTFEVLKPIAHVPFFQGALWSSFFRFSYNAFLAPDESFHEVKLIIQPADSGVTAYDRGNVVELGVMLPIAEFDRFLKVLHASEKAEGQHGQLEANKTIRLVGIRCRLSDRMFFQSPPAILTEEHLQKTYEALQSLSQFTLNFHAPLRLKAHKLRPNWQSARRYLEPDSFVAPSHAVPYLLRKIMDECYSALDKMELNKNIRDCELEKFSLVSFHGRWTDWSYGRKPFSIEKTLGGIMGTVTIAGPMTPSLALALIHQQWLGVGKNRAFAYGQYTVLEVQSQIPLFALRKTNSLRDQVFQEVRISQFPTSADALAQHQHYSQFAASSLRAFLKPLEKLVPPLRNTQDIPLELPQIQGMINACRAFFPHEPIFEYWSADLLKHPRTLKENNTLWQTLAQQLLTENPPKQTSKPIDPLLGDSLNPEPHRIENFSPLQLGLKITQFRFALHFETPVTLNHYPEVQFRALLDRSLKRSYCHVSSGNCARCTEQPQCFFFQMFETTTLAPFVLAVNERQPARGPVQNLGLEISLFGPSGQQLPALMVALEQLGMAGIRQDSEKSVPFHLGSVEGKRNDDWVLLWSANHGILSDDYALPNPNVFRSNTLSSCDKLTLEWITPWGTLDLQEPSNFSFPRFFHIILKRTVTLSQQFDEPLTLDWSNWLEKAAQVQCTDESLTQHRVRHYSWRCKRALFFQTWRGSIQLEGPLDDFLPWLEWGSVIHVGKNTSFGLGRYRIVQSIESN